MLDVRIEGLDKLRADLARIAPEARARLLAGPMRQSAEAMAEEGNRRVHSPRGHARTFRVYTTAAKAVVSPGSRANFFSQRFMPVLDATVNATHSRVENIIRDAVEQAVRMVLR